MKTLIIGANSDIARALVIQFIKQGDSREFILASRNEKELQRFARDLKVRFFVDVIVTYLDVTDFSTHDDFISNMSFTPDCIVYAAGHLSDQNNAQSNFMEALNTINANYTGAVSLLEKLVIKTGLSQGESTIVAIASVAGERGRASNYIYGSAKAGLIAYLSGLRARCHAKTNVITVLPGFVATKMTSDLELPVSLTASPEMVARAIIKAIKRKRSKIYVKLIWRFIMIIIKLIPERIFKRLKI